MRSLRMEGRLRLGDVISDLYTIQKVSMREQDPGICLSFFFFFFSFSLSCLILLPAISVFTTTNSPAAIEHFNIVLCMRVQ